MKPIRLYYLLAAFIATWLVAACTKGDETLPAEPAPAQLNVINTTNQTINFYLNGTRQNDFGIVAGNLTGYQSVPSGLQLYAFKNSFDRRNFENADTLFTIPLQLDSVGNRKYSLFVTGNTRSAAIFTADTLVADTSSKNAKLRFVHAAATLPALRVVVNDTVRYNNAAYRSVSNFATIGVGIKNISIYPANSSSPLLSTRQTIAPGRIYTLFIRGAVGGTGEAALTARLMVNQ